MTDITALLGEEAGQLPGYECRAVPRDPLRLPHPDFARRLVDAGIDSIPVNPDSFIAVREHVAAAEADSGRGRG